MELLLQSDVALFLSFSLRKQAEAHGSHRSASTPAGTAALE